MWEGEMACWTLLAEFCHYPTWAFSPPFERRPRASQGASSGLYRGEASSCPGDLELPPTDTVASRSDGRAAPARLEPIHNTPSLELAATSDGVVIAHRLIL